ncbi:integrase catalytic domain-containing protein [Trichonephila clavipes]|nr:integrase catalytic domain-containing protein [Trichonephila clavipes]
MTSLRLEVQGEEMVQPAKSSFGTTIRKRDSPTERVKPTELMTASALASSEKSSVLSEKKICGFISKIEDKRILNELKNKEIILSDLNCKETEIGLLIGTDNIGKLLTGNLIEFDSGLTAIETKLGWTVIGKVCSNDKNVMLTTSSLHVRNVSIKELWELDVLGITDPLLNENTKENFELTDFKNKMKILPDGRYEVKLPWKCNSENLPSNKELTWKRHLRMMNKLRNGKFFEDYKSVFRQWEDLNIIERVPEVELNNGCHYLPHRPVIKLDSATTKIRPVFDASAREKGKPSLNDCLYKGVNLIELIPDILDRFRIYPIGIVADIEKAFLMLSVAPKDRDYLRFFSPCNEKQLVYRHCRVMFGVSSSPYLLNASIMHLLENCNSECKEVALKLKSSFYVDNCVTGVFSADEIDIY